MTAYGLEVFNPRSGQWQRIERQRPFPTATDAVIYGALILPTLTWRWCAIRGELQ